MKVSVSNSLSVENALFPKVSQTIVISHHIEDLCLSLPANSVFHLCPHSLIFWIMSMSVNK